MIKFKGHTISHFEHMVHHSNIKSILERGVLSHNQAHKLGLISKDISMDSVQMRRKIRKVEANGRKISIGLHDFVSFYFNTRNPMLYVRKEMQHELLIILIDTDILKTKLTDKKFSIFSDGNAGSAKTKFYCGEEYLKELDIDLIFGPGWNNSNDTIKTENKRKRCAEVLIYPIVGVCDIKTIICPTEKMNQYVTDIMNEKKIKDKTAHILVQTNPRYFF